MTETTAPSAPDNVFEIPGANLAGFEEKIGKLANRAAKLNVGEVTYTVLSTRTKAILDERGRDTGRVATIHTIEVNGDTPCLPGGWRLLAAIEPLAPGANSVLRVPGDETPLSVDYWTCDMRCDHCNTKRQRKNSFLVVNDAGDIKLVGRNCIADFLGHEDPKAILRFAQYIFEAIRMGGDAEEMGWGGAHAGGAPEAHGLIAILAAVSACIRAGGWVSKGRAYETGGDSTADDVNRLWNPPRDSGARAAWQKWADLREVNDLDRADAKDAAEWAAAIDLEKANDYMRNVATTGTFGYAVHKTFGIACSILPTFRRERDRDVARRQRAEATAGSKFVGEVGKREVFTLTVDMHRTFEGQYGTTHMYLLHDADGNVFKWMASSGQGFDVGCTYTGKATVKNHDDYKGTKQTVINRGKFEPVLLAA